MSQSLQVSSTNLKETPSSQQIQAILGVFFGSLIEERIRANLIHIVFRRLNDSNAKCVFLLLATALLAPRKLLHTCEGRKFAAINSHPKH